MHKKGDTVSWIDGNFDVTVNILAGLIMVEKYIDKKILDIRSFIEGAKCFIENSFLSLASFHPVSLGFILFIYSNKSTYYPSSLKPTCFVPAINKTQSVHKISEEKMNIDILMMVATEEEKAITNYEHFEERELDNGIRHFT